MSRGRREGWQRWLAHPFGGVVCSGHARYPAFAPRSSEVAVGISGLFVSCPEFAPTAHECTQLLLVPYSFFVFCCSRGPSVQVQALQQRVPGPSLSHKYYKQRRIIDSCLLEMRRKMLNFLPVPLLLPFDFVVCMYFSGGEQRLDCFLSHRNKQLCHLSGSTVQVFCANVPHPTLVVRGSAPHCHLETRINRGSLSCSCKAGNTWP